MENPLAFPWADTSAPTLSKFLTISSKILQNGKWFDFPISFFLLTEHKYYVQVADTT